MLALLVFLPLAAFLAILLGVPARLTAVGVSAFNLVLGVSAAGTWHCSCWSFSLPVLEKPALHLAFGFPDGMSVIMVLLTVIVTLAAVLSGTAPAGREKLYFGSSLLISGGALGAFAATDLFFFYAFHELALIPTFLMIGMLGRGDRRAAAWKITIYLGLGSIVLLAGLVWLANLTGTYDMGKMVLVRTHTIDPAAQKGIAALLLVGFGTLVSLFPFHSWAAPAYASAPAPVAMLHAGVLKKFGLYGLLRLAIPLVPHGLQAWLTPLLILLLGNVLWVGFVTISQKRLDGMLGNSSVMHMGYIFLAIAALIAFPANPLAQPAAIVLMFAHGVSIALLFGLADRIERSTGTLDLSDMGGLAKSAPKLAFLFGIAAMAAIGLPGLANFAGEILVFLAAFWSYNGQAGLGPVQIACIFSLWGVVISAVYMLRAYRNIFQGRSVKTTESAADLTLSEQIPQGPSVKTTESAADLTLAEQIPALLLVLALVAVGLYPNLLLNLLK
ncbi:MAG: NADH-quinone oxidoreductase subunit M [Verrucomicrobia bacterium]|nr:NADH-quinone oxidoreductase subunit M [Verrucomicrobiota bacterium]